MQRGFAPARPTDPIPRAFPRRLPRSPPRAAATVALDGQGARAAPDRASRLARHGRTSRRTEIDHAYIHSHRQSKPAGRPASISRRSRPASRPPGRPATMPSSAPPCRSSASNCARRSTSAPGQKVLDVAAGNGNVVARRRPPLVRGGRDRLRARAARPRARARAAPNGSASTFREADAEALPFADDSFDVVVSTFGVMFTPDQDRAAAELLRVCKPRRQDRSRQLDAGRLHRPGVQDDRQVHAAASRRAGRPPCGARPRGSTSCSGRTPLRSSRRNGNFVFRYRSPEHWLDIFKTYYGPLLKTFAALDAPAQRRTRRRSHGADRPIQPLGRRLHGGAERLSRNRHHQELRRLCLRRVVGDPTTRRSV